MPDNEQDIHIKLLPRNASALRRGLGSADPDRLAAGNSSAMRLESGVGNCYPGLECDLRNLERRFIPFLECNFVNGSLRIVKVDLEGAAEAVSGAQLQAYRRIANQLQLTDDGGSNCEVVSISGDFGPYGNIDNLPLGDLNAADSAGNDRPPSAWTAVRLLRENSPMLLRIDAGGTTVRLEAGRAAYLADDGSLAPMFAPGELSQSLCSPWTHDFRDCSCFYWASNHPDIVQPELPASPSHAPEWDAFVDWERRARGAATPPPAATAAFPDELRHYEINQRWQQLHIVVNGREATRPVGPETAPGTPFASDAELETALRRAAGIELAVMQEYLCAYYSLHSNGAAGSPLRAARSELLRIAVGEMRHLRVVNEILGRLTPAGQAFNPALHVSTTVPRLTQPDHPRQFRPLTLPTLDDFIEVESGAHAIDRLYSNIIATFRARGQRALAEVASSIISDGEDHLETFRFMREWIAPLGAAALQNNGALTPAPAGNADNAALQKSYLALLNHLDSAYRAGMPAGANEVIEARKLMTGTGTNSISQIAQRLAQAGHLVIFADPGDPRFTPLP